MSINIVDEKFDEIADVVMDLGTAMAAEDSENAYDVSLFSLGVLAGIVMIRKGKAPDRNDFEACFISALSTAKLSGIISYVLTGSREAS